MEISGHGFTARNLPQQKNMVDISCMKELRSPIPFRNFSVKYVAQGCEKYTINGNKYEVTAGQYLLANYFSNGSVEINSKDEVKGICIEVAPELLSQVVSVFKRPDHYMTDLSLDTFFNSADFCENKYQVANSNVGSFLRRLEGALSAKPYGEYQFEKDFYFQLAENIVLDHLPLYKQLQAIPTLKYSTKKDLLRRLLKGKEFIDEHFRSTVDVKKIAAESCLSEYHFLRLFKGVFEQSPYQYLLQKRLSFAADLIRNSNYSISEIAVTSGFTDIYSFSKSFKKHFGYSPSHSIRGIINS